ncbi:lactonase family protein [Burkholderia sp. Bp9143]|uniref:lactonase family protein n=1 Tax=Burkholderia sp. Bp9143 TaxID=2184574 RepID=UPI000F5B5CDA|nr:lactonase family protein [Burkholderia sp. Bp9143]RQR31432.1 lactonase family protein [Burkholderia sp. Bp9143]
MSRTFAYVGCRTTRERNARGTGIVVYEVDDTGAWAHLQTLEPLVNPSFLAFNARQDVLYAVHGDGSSVSAYRVDPATGRIAALNDQPCEGRNPVHLALSRDGTSLVVAGYATGTASRLAIADDGRLGEVIAPVLSLTGKTGPHRIEQTGSHPHHISRYVTRRFDTDWHIVPDKGLDTVFAVCWAEGAGSPVVRSARCREGAGPRHAAFHPELPLIYVSNELDSTVTTWSFEPQTGQLEPLSTVSIIPAAFHGQSRAAGIAIAPDGRALHVTNRGHDSVATVALDAATGLPASVHWTSALGVCPRFLCLSPDGRYLYVANEHSHTIVQYAVDAAMGRPVPTGRVIETGSPVCILFKTNEE